MADFSQLVIKLELQQQAFQKGMDDAAKRLAKVQQSAKQAQSGMASLESGMKAVATAAAAAASAFAAFKSVEAIATASDKIKNLQGSFTALLGDAGRAGDMMARVFGIVERTGAPLDAVAGATQRLSIALKDVGASNQQIATIAETFVKLGKVGGSSAAETANSLQQLGQALASGKLGGDELKSIRENAPLVAQAIADGMGVTTGALKQLGEEGKLTTEAVANAMIKAAAKADAAFANLPRSFEQALNQMQAQATLFGAALDKSTGTTTTLVTLTDTIAGNLKRWTEELERSNTQMGGLKQLAELMSLVARVAAAAWVAAGGALEIIVIRLGFIAEQLKLILTGDWEGVSKSTAQMRLDVEAAANAAERAIRALLNMEPMAASAAAARAAARGDELKPATPTIQPKPGGGGGGGGGGKSDAEKEAEALKKKGEALAAAVDAQNAYNQKLIEYNELLAKGAISETIYAKAVEQAKQQLTAQGDALRASVDPAFAFWQQVDKINQVLREGQIDYDTYIKLMEKLREEFDKQQGGKKKTPIEELTEDVTKAIGAGVGEFFTDIIKGSKSAADAFSKMVEKIITDLAKLLAEFAAKEASKFIIKSLFGGGAAPAAAGNAVVPSSLMLASRPPTFNAAASLAPSPFAAPRAANGNEAVGGAASGGSPWNVTVNNNAPGVDVTTSARPDGGLEVTIEKVRSVLAQDVMRGGNNFSRSLESAYSLGRGR